MTLRVFVFVTAMPLAAWGQASIENWAVPAGMNNSQTVSVIQTLNQPVLNRPFSATAIVHMTHTLEDGIHINQTTTTLMYRDAQGRRRNETDGLIDIEDPVSHAGIRINPATNTAVKRAVEYVVPEEKLSPLPVRVFDSTAKKEKGGGGGGKSATNRNAVVTENLGVQTLNGVLAYGVRTSLTIPVGAIGNDREIKSIKETWTSTDLHILVKSIDSDPRFGTSTYELTNIVRAAPDATLFQIQVPAGYTVRQEQRFTVNAH